MNLSIKVNFLFEIVFDRFCSFSFYLFFTRQIFIFFSSTYFWIIIILSIFHILGNCKCVRQLPEKRRTNTWKKKWILKSWRKVTHENRGMGVCRWTDFVPACWNYLHHSIMSTVKSWCFCRVTLSIFAKRNSIDIPWISVSLHINNKKRTLFKWNSKRGNIILIYSEKKIIVVFIK